jgi:hypothetical protein
MICSVELEKFRRIVFSSATCAKWYAEMHNTAFERLLKHLVGDIPPAGLTK